LQDTVSATAAEVLEKDDLAEKRCHGWKIKGGWSAQSDFNSGAPQSKGLLSEQDL
jgi:hypothetical protein